MIDFKAILGPAEIAQITDKKSEVRIGTEAVGLDPDDFSTWLVLKAFLLWQEERHLPTTYEFQDE